MKKADICHHIVHSMKKDGILPQNEAPSFSRIPRHSMFCHQAIVFDFSNASSSFSNKLWNAFRETSICSSFGFDVVRN